MSGVIETCDPNAYTGPVPDDAVSDESCIPAVTTYAARGDGARLSSFELDGLNVSVIGCGPESVEPAFALACRLARFGAELVARDETIERLKSELAAARAALPPKTPANLLGPAYARFQGSELWLLGNREKGFGHFGFLMADGWDELFRRFNVRVTDHGTDEHGPWWKVENNREVS